MSNELHDLVERSNLNLQVTPDGYAIIGPHDTNGRGGGDIQTRGNVYLLVEGSAAVIIDSGFGKEFYARLKELILGVGLDLNYIILTHFHYDHVGGAKKLSEDFGAPIIAHEEDSPYIEKPFRIRSYGLQNNSLDLRMKELSQVDTPSREDIEELYPLDVSVNETVQGGEVIQLGDKRIKLLHTPGHTPGSISLFVEETKSLYVSDLDYCVNPALPPNLGNVTLLKDSLEKVLRLEVGFLGPGHLYTLREPEMIEDYLRKTLNTIKEVSERIMDLLSGPSSSLSLKEIVNRLYPVTPRFAYEPVLSFSVLCHLYEAKQKNRVEELAGGTVEWSLS